MRPVTNDLLREGGVRVRVKTPPGPGDEGYERAVSLGRFLVASKDEASRAAVGNAHLAVIEEMQARLESLGDTLLATIRSGAASERESAAMRLEDVAGLMRAVGAAESAEVFLRRVAAARAA